jgi:O-methyltransferase
MLIKKLLRKIIENNGYILLKKDNVYSIDELYYSNFINNAKYSPWLGDNKFNEIYQRIKEHTLVDRFKCYELWQLAEKTAELDSDCAIIEIGVWRGGSAAILSGKLALINRNLKIYLADTFKGVVKTSEKDYYYKGSEHNDTNPGIVEELLNNVIRYSNYKILQGIFPEESAHLIPEGVKFGLCHIDVDVYSSAKDIVEWIWDKMIIGGMIIFDDYGFESCTGITRYVEELRDLPDRILIHNLNGHAILIKIK